MTTSHSGPEFSHPLEIDDLTKAPYRVRLVASKDMLAALAERLGIPAVLSLEGFVEVIRKRDLLVVEGQVQALLRRTCVTSLETLEEHIDDSFILNFTTASENIDYLPGAEMEVDLDAPEPLSEKSLDLADLLITQVSLAMTPYPRKEGASPVVDRAEPVNMSPFAILGEKTGHNSDS